MQSESEQGLQIYSSLVQGHIVAIDIPKKLPLQHGQLRITSQVSI